MVGVNTLRYEFNSRMQFLHYREHSVSVTKNSQLQLFKESVAVNCDKHKKPKLSGNNAKI
jgi:hypothetical protein